MNNTGSNPTQGGVSLGGGIADAITGSLGLHHGHNISLGLPAVHAHAALGHNNTGNLGPSANPKGALTSSASDSQTNTSANNNAVNANNHTVVTGPKTGIEENLSVSATSLGPNHFGLRHLLRTWVAFAIKRRSFSLLAKASTLAAKTGVTMDNILCEEDDSVAAAAAQATASTLSPSALIAAADASGDSTAIPTMPLCRCCRVVVEQPQPVVQLLVQEGTTPTRMVPVLLLGTRRPIHVRFRIVPSTPRLVTAPPPRHPRLRLRLRRQPSPSASSNPCPSSSRPC